MRLHLFAIASFSYIKNKSFLAVQEGLTIVRMKGVALAFCKAGIKTKTGCFAKYSGQSLKTVGVHCFPGALVQVPSNYFSRNNKKGNL